MATTDGGAAVSAATTVSDSSRSKVVAPEFGEFAHPAAESALDSTRSSGDPSASGDSTSSTEGLPILLPAGFSDDAGSQQIVSAGTHALIDTLTPRGALLRSAILPGWGQLRNGKPVKAVLFAGATGGFLTAAILDVRAVRRAVTPEEEEDRAARRNTRVLYFFMAATLSALDAFVDAHLADFGDEPVLPSGGAPPPQIRWTVSF